jgi:hypothetical protein
MYIFELISEFIKGKKYKKSVEYNPLEVVPDGLEEDSENCEHLFMPLDSTKELFACKYCGLVVPRKDLKNVNIFEGEK